MVATPHPLATAAGVEALRSGGSAVDAAVAANAMLAVVYCNACGLGGDAFALVWDPVDGRLHGFNGSGRSPAALTIDAVRDAGHETMPQRGPLTIDVPGAVDAWVQLLDRFGRRSLADALAPAARTADEGYELTGITAARHPHRAPDLRRAARAVFGGAGGPGDTFRQPLLAATLRAIAGGGREAYYGGPIGDEIARAIQAAGGVMTAEDVAAHRGDWVEPISTTYAGVEVATIPPNSQGITALMALNVLRRSTGRWTRRSSAFTRRSRRSRWPGASATDASPTPIAAGRTHRCCSRRSTPPGWRHGCRRTRRIGTRRRTRREAARSTSAPPMRTG